MGLKKCANVLQEGARRLIYLRNFWKIEPLYDEILAGTLAEGADPVKLGKLVHKLPDIPVVGRLKKAAEDLKHGMLTEHTWYGAECIRSINMDDQQQSRARNIWIYG